MHGILDGIAAVERGRTLRSTAGTDGPRVTICAGDIKTAASLPIRADGTAQVRGSPHAPRVFLITDQN